MDQSRPTTFRSGLHDVFKFYSIQGLHQAIDIADVMFNGAKWRSLPPDLQAIVETALTASLFDAMLYFAHENAKALKEIRAEGVTIFDAPADYAPAFIKSAKKVLAELEAKDPFFKKVLKSQRAFANVVVPYTRETSKLSTLISGAVEGSQPRPGRRQIARASRPSGSTGTDLLARLFPVPGPGSDLPSGKIPCRR